MATRLICDSCGADNAERMTINVFSNNCVVRHPYDSQQSCELCQKCIDKMFAALSLVLTLKKRS